MEWLDKSSIYTIMVMTDLSLNKQTKFPEFGFSRFVGWYPEYDVANWAVINNVCDINETCYDYALIEEWYVIYCSVLNVIIS